MDELVQVITVEGSDVTVTPNQLDTTTTELLSAPGDDSPPLPGDFGLKTPVSPQGDSTISAFSRPESEQMSAPGEKRIYARNADGETVCYVHLKADGAFDVLNMSGKGIKAAADGTIDINGVVISPDGAIEAPSSIDAKSVAAETSLKVATKEVNLHVHPAGQPPGPTGPF